jgi:hypothetical protein
MAATRPPRNSLLGLTSWAAAAVALMAMACVHAPAGNRGPEEAGQPAPAHPQPELVLVTGSRIPQRVDISSGLAATTSPVRIYSRTKILETGHDGDLGAALRTLDPDIVIHH